MTNFAQMVCFWPTVRQFEQHDFEKNAHKLLCLHEVTKDIAPLKSLYLYIFISQTISSLQQSFCGDISEYRVEWGESANCFPFPQQLLKSAEIDNITMVLHSAYIAKIWAKQLAYYDKYCKNC